MIAITGCPFSGVEKVLNHLKSDYVCMTKKYSFESTDVTGKLDSLYGDERYREYNQFVRNIDAAAIPEAVTKVKEAAPDGLWDGNYGANHAIFEIAGALRNTVTPVLRLPSDFILACDEKDFDKVLVVVNDPSNIRDDAETFNAAMTSILSPKRGGLGLSRFMTAAKYVGSLLGNFDYRFLEVLYNFFAIKDVFGDKVVVVRFDQDTLPQEVLDITNGLVPDPRGVNTEEGADFNNLRAQMFSVLVNNNPIGPSTVELSGQANIIKAKQWYCVRAGRMVTHEQCDACIQSSGEVFLNNPGIAERDWQNYPCAWECVYNVNGTRRTVKESVDDNFWEALP